MKFALGCLVVTLALVAWVWFRPPETYVVRPLPPVPVNLVEHLEQSENRVQGLREGTARGIVWADSAQQKTPYAIIYIPGFTATRAETAPMADTVAARLGANLYYARLSGHGTTADGLADATVQQWLDDMREAYAIGQVLGERVIVMGTSMGGALSTWLTAQDDVDPAALVLISPAFALRDEASQRQLDAVLRLPAPDRLIRLIAGGYRTDEFPSEEAEHFWTARYRTDAVLDLARVFQLLQVTPLQHIETPALLVHSPSDKVVDADLAAERFSEFSSPLKRRVEFNESQNPFQHVIAGRILSPNSTLQVADLVSDFLIEATSN